MKWKSMVLLLSVIFIFSSCSEGTEPSTEETQETLEVTEPVESEVVHLPTVSVVEALGSGDVRWNEEATDYGFNLVYNQDGATLGYSQGSGVTLIQVDGFAFKDLNQNGMLDLYEDWRLDANIRATDLASQMTVEQIAGLMLYSPHQFSVDKKLTDDQVAFLDGGGRAMLNAATAASTKNTAEWNNSMQMYVEGIDLGIPVNTSSDPRTEGISLWPSNLALAATFNPLLAFESGQVISEEYRLLGIGTYLGPQIDLATEPRWSRIQGTFGSDPALSRDMTNSFVSGLQSTYDDQGDDLGWGADSMNAMIKHWPGDGAGEGGRESHYFGGNHTVYPGEQFSTHFIPFVDGGFNLEGETKSASAVMASYSIAWSDDEDYGDLVGSAYSTYKIRDILRGEYGFDGVICTDWGVTEDVEASPMAGKSYGVSDLSIAERHYEIILAGVDQFGGNNDPNPIIEAYEIGEWELGENEIRDRFEESARRLTKNIFKIGLFENPYVDVKEARSVVNNDDFITAGYEAQLQSVVMVKNEKNAIAQATETLPTVYIPMVYIPADKPFFGPPIAAHWKLPIDQDIVSEYMNIITDTVKDPSGPVDADGNPTVSPDDIIRASATELETCDYALAVVRNPINVGSYFTGYGYDHGTEEYIPISLQYGEYTADSKAVRKESLSGDMIATEQDGVYGVQIVEVKENRSYFGNSSQMVNSLDLDAILYAADTMPSESPVIVAVKANGPMVLSEFEDRVDAIIFGFGINDKALIEVATGHHEPSGLLPLQLPKNMETVEAQFEDVPRDMDCYIDSVGNTYDFAFGLNWSGVISDNRTKTYRVDPLVGARK